jgi:hypothetical protein
LGIKSEHHPTDATTFPVVFAVKKFVDIIELDWNNIFSFAGFPAGSAAMNAV